jgi:hypothetical protein
LPSLLQLLANGDLIALAAQGLRNGTLTAQGRWNQDDFSRSCRYLQLTEGPPCDLKVSNSEGTCQREGWAIALRPRGFEFGRDMPASGEQIVRPVHSASDDSSFTVLCCLFHFTPEWRWRGGRDAHDELWLR